MIENKLDEEQVNVLLEPKVNKEDVKSYIPDTKRANIGLETKLITIQASLEEQIKQSKMHIDSKFVKLRQEFDMGLLKKTLSKKAELKDVEE